MTSRRNLVRAKKRRDPAYFAWRLILGLSRRYVPEDQRRLFEESAKKAAAAIYRRGVKDALEVLVNP